LPGLILVDVAATADFPATTSPASMISE
jgi:hypothetical protein